MLAATVATAERTDVGFLGNATIATRLVRPISGSRHQSSRRRKSAADSVRSWGYSVEDQMSIFSAISMASSTSMAEVSDGALDLWNVQAEVP